ncbi:hypothetical protein HMPREF0496_1142 [Lentilactobacillus hilgardii ATCC 27305]|nr:hypothetical protein HMPREF0496_1142 [Lentilactobacillus hilgardii ATCC 27305]
MLKNILSFYTTSAIISSRNEKDPEERFKKMCFDQLGGVK